MLDADLAHRALAALEDATDRAAVDTVRADLEDDPATLPLADVARELGSSGSRLPDPAPQQYAVELTKRAAETLGKLDRPTQRRILAALVLLQSNPRPPGMTALVGRPGELRVRVGDHRIV